MWALQAARLASGEVVDILVDGEVVHDAGPGAAAALQERIDCRGKLVLPAFIDSHVHLDKALIRDDLREHDGTLAGAIGAIHERKRRYSVEDVRARAREVIEESLRLGTTRLRSHVDVDTIGTHFHTVVRGVEVAGIPSVFPAPALPWSGTPLDYGFIRQLLPAVER